MNRALPKGNTVYYHRANYQAIHREITDVINKFHFVLQHYDIQWSLDMYNILPADRILDWS